ncbi:MAG: hypothetical protein DDG60_11165 [Anaerolineae bacterium]|nr:MAG: hypothetical protein DDG60_11165 [Anaerolineae bacterium]
MKRFIEYIGISKEKRGGTILLALALTTAAIAQITLGLSYSQDPAYWNVREWLIALGNNTTPVPGLSLYVLAAILLILSTRALGWNVSPLQIEQIKTTAHSFAPPRYGFWLTAIGLALLAASYTAQPTEAQENGYALALTWLLSLVLFTYSVLRESSCHLPRWQDWRAALQQNRLEILGVIFVLLLALIFRAYDVEIHPYSMMNDEGEMGKGALCLLRGECQNIFAIGWASQPYLAYVPYALSVGVLGNENALPVRLVSVLSGTLAVLFPYLLAREMFGKSMAFVASMVLAALPYHVHFSRLGVDNIADSLTSALVLWLVWRGIRSGTVGWYLLAGIVSGLCFYTYPGSRVAPVLGLLMWTWAALTQHGLLRTQWRNLVAGLVVALLTVAPLMGTYQSNKEFNQRLDSVGLLQNNRLQEEMNFTGLNAAQVLTVQFFKSALVFINTDGPFQFFSTPRAYFTPVAALFLMLGLTIAIWKFYDVRFLGVLAWFFAPLVLGSTLTVGPPSNQRMLGSAPAAALLVALGIVTITQLLGNLSQFTRRLAPLLLTAFLAFNLYQDTHFYFVEYRQGHFFEDLNNEITYESRTLIRSLPKNGRLFLIGEPMTRVHYGNFGYFAPEIEKYDFNQVTRETLASLPRDQDALFLAIPAREAELRQIAAWLPGGQWIAEHRRNQPEYPLYFAYKLSKEQLQSFVP